MMSKLGQANMPMEYRGQAADFAMDPNQEEAADLDRTETRGQCVTAAWA